MANDYLLIPLVWRKTMLVARLALALDFLFESYRTLGWGYYVELDLGWPYLVFALFSVFWEKPQRPPLAIYSLTIDAIFLMALLWIQAFSGAWLPSLWFVYLISSALLLHPSSVVPFAVLAGLPGIFKNPQFREAAIPISFLGMIAAGLKSQFEDRLFKLSRESVMHRAEAQVARATEREHIAADLHDGALQTFVSVQMRMEVVRRTLLKNFDKGIHELEQLQELWKKQIDEVREFIRDIRSQSEPAPADLAIALSHLVDAFEKQSQIDVEFSGTADLDQLAPEKSVEILQLVREAFHNIHKHSNASYVNLHVDDDGSSLDITIRDNGQGFPFAGKFTMPELEILGRGPVSILRRTRNLNADLTLESSREEGSRIQIRIPR